MDDEVIAAIAAGDDTALRELLPGMRPGSRSGCAHHFLWLIPRML
jgi:hypothetical protein